VSSGRYLARLLHERTSTGSSRSPAPSLTGAPELPVAARHRRAGRCAREALRARAGLDPKKILESWPCELGGGAREDALHARLSTAVPIFRRPGPELAQQAHGRPDPLALQGRGEDYRREARRAAGGRGTPRTRRWCRPPWSGPLVDQITPACRWSGQRAQALVERPTPSMGRAAAPPRRRAPAALGTQEALVLRALSGGALAHPAVSTMVQRRPECSTVSPPSRGWSRAGRR